MTTNKESALSFFVFLLGLLSSSVSKQILMRWHGSCDTVGSWHLTWSQKCSPKSHSPLWISKKKSMSYLIFTLFSNSVSPRNSGIQTCLGYFTKVYQYETELNGVQLHWSSFIFGCKRVNGPTKLPKNWTWWGMISQAQKANKIIYTS